MVRSSAVRALCALVLLVAFPVLLLAIVAALAAFTVFAFVEAPVLGVKIAIIVVPTIWVLLQTLVAVERAEAQDGEKLPGYAVAPDAQPELWALVRDLAEFAGTRPPDELRLIVEANAAVVEKTRLLGLVASTRRLYIGVPLLAGLSQEQLAAVLTHELAHYGNRDTRLAPVTYRGVRMMARTTAALAGHRSWLRRLLAEVFTAYAKIYLQVSQAVCRKQELAADEASAHMAGSAAASAALRELAALDAAWVFFLEHYLTVGWDAGYLPADSVEGFTAMYGARSAELEELRENPPVPDISPYDSHPPIVVRAGLIEALDAAPARAFGTGRAIDLLHEPNATLDAALIAGLVDEAKAKQRVDWSRLMTIAAEEQLSKRTTKFLATAGTLTGGAPTLRAALDALDDGKLAELTETRPGQSDAGPRARLEIARRPVREALGGAAQLALARAGEGRWQVSWTESAEFEGPELADALDAAVGIGGSAPDTTALRTALAGVDLDRPLTGKAEHGPVNA